MTHLTTYADNLNALMRDTGCPERLKVYNQMISNMLKREENIGRFHLTAF